MAKQRNQLKKNIFVSIPVRINKYIPPNTRNAELKAIRTIIKGVNTNIPNIKGNLNIKVNATKTNNIIINVKVSEPVKYLEPLSITCPIIPVLFINTIYDPLINITSKKTVNPCHNTPKA